MSYTINVDIRSKRALKALRIAPAKILEATREGNKKAAQETLGYFDKTVSTWRRKPIFGMDIDLTPGGSKIAVGTPSGVYHFISDGTSIRWAVMSADWESKTQPGIIPAQPGRGRVLIAGRQAMQARNIAPRPGIEAREFDKSVYNEMLPRARKIIGRSISRAVRKIK